MNDLIMDRTRCLIDSFPENVIDKLTNQRRDTRVKALRVILKSLDQKEEDDNSVIQTIPLYLTSIGDFEAAIWFLATLISCDFVVPVEVLNEVYSSTVLEMHDPEVKSDLEFMEVINRKINLLMTTANKKESYKENSKFLITLWKDYERKGDFKKAISTYDILISNWDEIWYLYSALAYKELWENEFAISLLEQAYNIYWDKIFLENIIIMYNQLWNTIKAKEFYSKLISTTYNEKWNTKEKVVLPFIMYSFIIEDDVDLKNFEVMMANHFLGNEIVILEPMQKISLVANNYIEWNLEVVRSKIESYNIIWVNNLSEHDRQEYDSLIIRKLFLMQVHITILKEDKYLAEHLSDLNILSFSRDEEKINILTQYFDEHISLLVKWDLNSKPNESIEDEEDDSEKFSFGTFDNLAMYVATLSMIFFHWKNYKVMSKKLFPFLEKCYKEIDEMDENEIPNSTQILKREADYIDTFTPLLHKSYNDFIDKIDVKYGKYIRVNLQNIARDSIDIGEDDYPEILTENKELALLFFIEKLISRNFPNMDIKAFWEFMEKYDLDGLGKDDLLLFTLLIFDNSYDLTIDLVVNNDILVNNIYAIYYLLESLVNIWTNSELRKSLKSLNVIFQETYWARWILSYIRSFMIKLQKSEDITEQELSYLMLCNWNMAILQKKWPETIMLSFKTAEDFEATEGTLQLWNIYEVNGYFDQSISKFEEAYTIDSNINNLSKLIGVLLNKWDLDRAYSMIQTGLKSKYDMDLYLYSYHILKWNLSEAMSAFMGVLNKNIPILDVPEWTLALFMEKCHAIKTMDSEINFDSLKLKFMSSFITSKMDLMYTDWSKSVNIFSHWITAFSIFHNVPIYVLPKFLNETLLPICWTDPDISSEIGLEVDNMKKAIIILDFYANHVYKSLLKLSTEIESLEELDFLHKLLNDYSISFVALISQLDWTEKLVSDWRKKMYFKQYKDTQIMDESLMWDVLLN